MAANRSRQNNEREEQGSGISWGKWAVGAAVTAGIGLGTYMLTRKSEIQSENPSAQEQNQNTGQNSSTRRRALREYSRASSDPTPSPSVPTPSFSMAGYLSDLFARLYTGGDRNGDEYHYIPERRGVCRARIPQNPTINNLSALLDDIYVRYVALTDDDFELYYSVFIDIFNQIHKKMKEVDPYFGKYSSTVQLAGSHYDRLRIKKPDEFDVVIIIGVPLNLKVDPFKPTESDIVLEPKEAGFIQLRMGTQYQKLLERDPTDIQINRIAYRWKDEQDYLTNAKFMAWFKGVVDKALNLFDQGPDGPVIVSKGIRYTIKGRRESGPARTIYIENKEHGFNLDVDLVPALKFPEGRWPITSTYRDIRPSWRNPENSWLVVAKPNKNGHTSQDKDRAWRIGMPVQERKLMHNSYHLRQVVRLLKKLRDALGMNKIASYYIKTLALWEALEQENELNYWRQSNADLFKIMVKKLYDALTARRIPYFWNKNSNLLAHISPSVLQAYANKLEGLVIILQDAGQYKHVAKYLLSPEEFEDYNRKFLHI